ncbi:MAG: hypothetical protein ACD_46C00030G0010 [uncultured bacterium]|nr:MAG: hypothetical protein ACD_46C00030G0010 [uncultured bacterium]
MNYQIIFDQTDESIFKNRYVGCLVLTQDQKILLQQRGLDWPTFPGYLAEFGGKIEANETPTQAITRELNEELGASVNEADLLNLGAVTEEMSKHTELIYVYFWHDKQGTITGCYEGEAKYFDNVNAILKNSNITDGLRWLLVECQNRGLIK